MRVLKSEEFKWRVLLDAMPGEQVIINCNSRLDAESKATACRAAMKRRPEEFKAMGVKTLKVSLAENTVLVTLVPEDE